MANFPSSFSFFLQTLDLLYHLCNNENVAVVCNKFIDFLGDCQDPHQQDAVVNKILVLADNFRPSFVWYIDTVETVLKTGLVELKSPPMAVILKNLRKGNETKSLCRFDGNVCNVSYFSVAKDENLGSEVWNDLVEKYTRQDLLDQKLDSCIIQLIVWVTYRPGSHEANFFLPYD